MVRTTHEVGVPVAICGMAMRLPGGISTSGQLWNALLSKKDARREVPAERYNIDAFYNPESTKTGVVRTRHGYFIDHVDLAQFDASFFSMTRSELEKLDPQHRLLLEVTRECLENAGEVNWRGRDIGCYVGVFGEDWLDMHAKDTQDSGMYRITGYGDFLLANRISYEYDFRGPSVTMKTGCSSSLICLHMATTAIRNGEISAAIVGGSNLIISPTMTQAMFDQGVLSPNGSCRTFDADADGYARGEAINGLYVKRLDLALRDGNPIRAIIRGSASNSDGKTPGIAHPSSESHEALIRSCYQAAGLDDFSQTGLVECHGTGTKTGDPLEATAVANVFGTQGVYVSSIKPNLGHSEGASGLTSIIKCVLALENRIIPPNIKFNKPSPKIPFHRGLRVPTEPIPWPKDRKERVSINSFGIGGANAHIILDSADSYGVGCMTNRPISTLGPRQHQLLVFTANHPESIRKGTADCRKFAAQNPDAIDDLAYTLALHREQLPHRSFAVSDGTSPPDFCPPIKASSVVPEIAFVFTGQGAQWPTMGLCLTARFPSALRDIERMDEVLQGLSGLAPEWSIRDELSKPADISRVDEAEFSQPLCTVVQIVLTNILRQWGVSPAVVVGHSSGEIAAAYACGALTMEEAVVCAYLRGLATKQQSRQGAMAAIGLGKKQVANFLKNTGVVIACENSPASTTLSGDQCSVDSVVDKIKHALPDVFARKLKVKMAYHSHHMTEIGTQYEKWLRSHISGQTPKVPMYSSVTDQVITEPRLLDAAYWRANLESPVLFHTAVEKILAERPSSILLEVGPHSALAGPLRQIMKATGANSPYVPTLIRNAHDTVSLLTAAGNLFATGIPLNLAAIEPQGQVLTTLPNYPWHHDTRYWHESRLSQEWRLRAFARHDILGAPVIECSRLEPIWRNMLRVDDVPWVRDHVVGGDVIFPGAGYVAMAGEAVRQVSSAAGDGRDTADGGFTMRRLTISAAMMLHEGAVTETMLTMRPLPLTNSLDSKSWFEFSVASCNGGAWTKHCAGQVRAGTGADSGAQRDLLEPIVAHPRKVPAASWYHTMRKAGLNYGPRFQGLLDISADPLRDVAAARIVDAAEEHESRYALHPTSIDMCIQLFSAAVARGTARSFGAMAVPTYFGEIGIASAARDDARSISVEVSAAASAKGAITGTCVAVSDDGSLVMHMNDVRLSPLDGGSGSESRDGHAGVRLAWKPHPDFVPASELIRSTHKVRTPYPLVQSLVLAVCVEAAERIQEKQLSAPPQHPHLSKYAEWLRGQVDSAAAQGYYPFVEDVSSLLALSQADRRQFINTTAQAIEKTEAAHVGVAITRVLDNIEAIFSEQTDPLEMLMQDDILTELYNMADGWDYTPLLDLMSHFKPHLRILEIGAGTGGTTAVVLAHDGGFFDARGRRKFSSYTYTDISTGLFAAASERFKDVPGMEFRGLDISKDPGEQGFDVESYDLVIATNVLHATENLGTTLANVRKMLRPGGTLLLQELCTSTKWINLIMGVLPGWWLGQADGRGEEPYVGPDRWARELAGAGFGPRGAEAVLLDDEMPYATNATMISVAARQNLPNHQPSSSTVDLLTENQHGTFASSMSAALQERGYAVRFVGLGDVPENDVLSILDIESAGAAFFDEIHESKFEAFKALAARLSKRQHGMLWLTRPCQIRCVEPHFAQIIGLARTLRNETGLELATMELDLVNYPREQRRKAEEAVYAVWERFQKRTSEGEEFDPDYEYAFDEGLVKIPRFEWISVAEELATAPQDLEPIQKEATKMLEIGKRGSLKSLRWVDKPQTSPLIGEEVRVDVQAVGMNFKDILIAMGVVDGTRAEGNGLGCECAGIIAGVGPAVSGLNVGDRVVVLAGNSYSTKLKTTASLCARMPDKLSFEEGATMPCVFGTVIHGLLEMARLEKGQSVLIHSACGGVGIAAIQVCQAWGAEIYATVGNEDKIHYLEDSFGIPRSRIFNSRDASFLPAVMRETDGGGVDIVLNSLSGELLHASWNCVAEFGKMVEIGKRDFIGQGRLAMDPFEANRSFFGVDIAQMCAERPRMIKRLLEKCMHLHEHGKIRPIPLAQTFDATHIQDAFRFMQKGDHIGKIVVRMADAAGEPPLHTTSIRPGFSLRPDAAYLLIGGLGGLGRSISTWMAEQGAKNLVYLSRSGGEANLGHDTLVQELAAMGCSAHIVAGSVVSLEDVKRVVRDVRARLCIPIAGVLQMSMVLRDSGFPQMTHDDWMAVAAPKVRGTYNLHEVLADAEHDLDFFVLFSSFSGLVGQWGQANYASANTFLDAFTQFRHNLGLPCSVIDIGPMDDVGYVSQNQAILETFRATGVPVLGEQMLLDALELAMRSSRPRGFAEYADKGSPIDNYTFISSSQLGIGLRMTRPLNTPGNRCIWKRDVRMAQYRNLESELNGLEFAHSSPGMGDGSDSNSGALGALIARVHDSPRVLVEPESIAILSHELAKTLAGFLMRSVEDVEQRMSCDQHGQTLAQALGMDSLVAIELRNWCRQRLLGSEVSVLEVMGAKSLDDLARTLVEGLMVKMGAGVRDGQEFLLMKAP